MKVLLTNDDGIDAAGLAALAEAVRDFTESVVVAPDCAHSGCGHRVTTDQELRLTQTGEGRFKLNGTPADCVRVALYGVVPDVQWILSGINHGGNLGADVHHSGTVAAAREAILHGFPGIAVSQYRRSGRVLDWPTAVRWLQPLLHDLMHRPWEKGTLWNINLPSPDQTAELDAAPEVVFCDLDPSPLPLSFHREGNALRYDGNYHHRQRLPGADVAVCFAGKIAVTRLSLL